VLAGEFTLYKGRGNIVPATRSPGEEGEMVPWLILLGVILAPSAAFLFWGWRASRSDMSLMRATETTPAADVAKLPPGSLVEVKGRLRCAKPVMGDLSKEPCAHFVASVERDYEILEYDPSRKASYRVRRTACELSNTLFATFEIEDGSGRATVSPEGAIIEGVEAIDRYERSAAQEERALPAAIGADVTLGRRYKEMHLPLDVAIYVLGVVDQDHRIGASEPGAKEQRFLISINTEEARTAALGSRGKWMLGFGAACLIGAVIAFGSAAWLTRSHLSQVDPPREVLQGESVW
jgi:E3 Ubiquitin ligase